MKTRIAVLASGNGSNLEAIMDHFRALGDAACGEVVLVASNRGSAAALERARNAGVDAVSFDAGSHDGLLSLLARHEVQLVVLAGFLKLIPPEVIALYRGRIVNVHPGPLPQFGGAGMYGIRVHEAVLAAGLHETAVTVHLVTEQYDDGPALCTWPVPVFPDDTATVLAARVLRAEHIVFPRIIDAIAATMVANRTDP